MGFDIDHQLAVECSGGLQSSIKVNVVFQMNLLTDLCHSSTPFALLIRRTSSAEDNVRKQSKNPDVKIVAAMNQP